MNRLPRILSSLTFVAILLAALGITAAAQDIPGFRVPADQAIEISTGIRVLPELELYAPADLTEFRTYTSFQWADLTALKYKLTFKEVATGIKHTLTVKNNACNGANCYIVPHQSGFLGEVKDGMVLTWQVTAIMVDGKVKSAVRTVTVNEVITPVLTNPSSGSTINYHSALSWTNANAVNDYFRVVMIDAQTGEKALNQFFDSSACAAECSITPHYLTNKLISGRTYKWYVLAVGYAREKAKSEVRIVTVDS
jgi:hypothetical protein